MMGIQNVAAIFCIPLIPPLLGYKIRQPHSVSPKRSKGEYRIWRYTGKDSGKLCVNSLTLSDNRGTRYCQKNGGGGGGGGVLGHIKLHKLLTTRCIASSVTGSFSITGHKNHCHALILANISLQ